MLKIKEIREAEIKTGEEKEKKTNKLMSKKAKMIKKSLNNFHL
jgi:hypothetical protein